MMFYGFLGSLDRLVLTYKFVIDRTKGINHPDFPDSFYPLDYGFLEGTTSGDGARACMWC